MAESLSTGRQCIPLCNCNVILLDPETRLSTRVIRDPFFESYHAIMVSNRIVFQIRIQRFDVLLSEDVRMDIGTQLEIWLRAGFYVKLEETNPLSQAVASIAPGTGAVIHSRTDGTVLKAVAISISRRSSAIIIEIPLHDSSASVDSLTEELRASIRVDLQTAVAHWDGHQGPAAVADPPGL